LYLYLYRYSRRRKLIKIYRQYLLLRYSTILILPSSRVSAAAAPLLNNTIVPAGRIDHFVCTFA
jgi:hypothetical protein